jgi:hypothetical protein
MFSAGNLEVVTSVQRRIKQLDQALGRKTLENDILREAVDFVKSKSGLRAGQYCPRTASEGCL